MSTDNRSGSDGFASNQMVVKKQRSEGSSGNAVAVVNSSTQNGALIQAVSTLMQSITLLKAQAENN